MASIQPSNLLRPSLPSHCIPTSVFLERASIYFGTCLPTPLAFASTFLGFLSILSWLCAQLPQIYKNYSIKSAAGLSIYFLIEWLMGDLTNLLGAIFTDQATWQILLASYYVFVDICLVCQYFWYTHALPKWRDESIHSSGSDSDDDASSDLINSLSPINSSFHDVTTDFPKDGEEQRPKSAQSQSADISRFSNIRYEKQAVTCSPLKMTSGTPQESVWAVPAPRALMYAATLSSLATQAVAAPIGSTQQFHSMRSESALKFAGVIISWSSTALYLGSRFPQLYKNWRRQSTAGLSPYLFMAAFSGNFFYSASMLANPSAWYDLPPYGGHGWADENGSRRLPWIANAAPFFLGAFGVLFLDGTMGIQFLMYGEQQEKVVKVRDRHGFSRWQRVNGWMRGWIPSITKERVVDLAESQRLLSESRELDRHGHQSQYGGI